MERNNKMVKKHLSICFIIMLSTIYSCKAPSDKDFVGTWKSSDSKTILKIEQNGFFETEGFNIHIPNNNKNLIINGNGKWSIVNRSNTFRIELIFLEPDSISNTFYDYHNKMTKIQYRSEQLFIHGSRFLGLSPPWIFYQILDDEEKWLVYKKNR